MVILVALWREGWALLGFGRRRGGGGWRGRDRRAGGFRTIYVNNLVFHGCKIPVSDVP